MNFLNASYVAAAALAGWYRRREIEVLVVDDDEDDHTNKQLKLPKPRMLVARDREYAHERAWAALRHTLGWCALYLACVHVYDTMRTGRQADIQAAWMTPLPYGCGDSHEMQSYAQSLVYTLYPLAAEQTCAAHLARRNASPWPNPLQALVDGLILAPLRVLVEVAGAMGEAFEHFLSHFSFLQQSALVPIAVVLVLLCVVLAPSFGCIRTYAARVRQTYTPAAKVEEKGLEGICMAEMERRWQDTMQQPASATRGGLLHDD